jgi:hypothetical protein
MSDSDSSILTSIEDMVNETPKVDRQEAFDALWAVLGELFEKVQNRFELTRDTASLDLESYSGKDGSGGVLNTYAGPEVDWLVHSWTGNPKATFTNMHLTISLGAQYDVPNIGLAFGTVPDLFWYMDFMPRKELVTNPDYADKYYGGIANKTFLALQADNEFKPFVSHDLYTRVAQTPTSICVGAPVKDENIATMKRITTEMIDQWIKWVDEAEKTPTEERETISQRDLDVRREICVRDPANVVAENLFGKEMTEKLVATLWGGNRDLPRTK